MPAKLYAILDRDGTIIEDVHYLRRPEEVSFIPGALEAMARLTAHGYGIIIITNQSGVGRGYFGMEDVEVVHQHLRGLLRAQGIEVEGIYYCPHAPDEHCACRKPQLGLVRQALGEREFTPENCVVIGDKPCDVELGRNLGAKTIMVMTGHGRALREEGEPHSDHVANDILEAVSLLLG